MIRKLIIMLMIISSANYFVNAQSLLDSGSKLEMPMDGSFKYGTLPNGLKYYLYNTNNPKHKIEMTFAVKAGRLYEEKPEVAHLVEHLLFRSLRKYPEGASNYLEQYGIKSNANTGGQMTIYSMELPLSTSKYQEIGLDLIRQWCDGALMADSDVESQKGAILEEYRSVGSHRNLDDKITSIILDHPKYPENIREISRSSLLSLTSTDVKAFYQKYYRPDKMSVIVVGNLEMDTVESFIQEKFSNLKNNTELVSDSILIDSWAAKLTGKNDIIILQDAGVEGMEFKILKKRRDASKFDALNSVDDYKKLYLEKLFNNLISERLVQLSKEPRSPIIPSFSYIERMGIHPDAQLDVFEIAVRVKNNLLKKAIQTTILELDNIIKSGFSSFEFDEAKKTLLKESQMRSQSSFQYWSANFQDHFYNGSLVLSPKDKGLLTEKLIKEISLNDINRMSSEWLKQDVDQDIVIVVPQRTDMLVPNKNDIKSWVDSRPTHSPRRQKRKVVAKGIMLTEEIDNLGDNRHMSNWNVEEKSDVSSITLPNGIKVHLKPCPSDPYFINLVGISPFGYARYPVKKQRQVIFVGDIVSKNGVAGLNSLELNEALTSNDANFRLSIGSCESSVNASTKNGNELEILFQLVYKRLTNSLLNFSEFKRWKSASRRELGTNSTNTETKLSFNEIYSNSTKFQLQPPSIQLTKSDLREMSFKEVTRLFNVHFANPSDFEFVITGNFDLEKVKLMVSKYLGSIPGSVKRNEVCNENVDIVKYPSKVFYEGDTDFADVNTVYSGIKITTEKDYVKLNLLSKMLKNVLFNRLRTVEGGIYDVLIGIYSRGENASLSISFRCDPSRIENLRSAMNEEIRNLITKGFPDSVLSTAKEATRNDINQKLELGYYWQEHVIDKIKGRSLYSLNNWESNLLEINEKEIRQAASMFLGEKNRTELTRIPELYTKSQ